MKQILVPAAASLMLSACSLFGIRSGYEEPRYRVIETLSEDIELRRYPPRLAAEVELEGTEGGVPRGAAFRVLFDYISGKNRSAAEIAMTVPVETKADAETIEMTAPVETSIADDGAFRMRFFLPASYDRESAPEPLDPRVRLVTLPEQDLAVIRFSGPGGEVAVTKKTDELLQRLGETAWRPAGAVSALFYDPPWTIPFLRRNEVAVPVNG